MSVKSISYCSSYVGFICAIHSRVSHGKLPFPGKMKMAVVCSNLFTCSGWGSWLCRLGPLHSCRTSKWMHIFYFQLPYNIFPAIYNLHKGMLPWKLVKLLWYYLVCSMSKSANWKIWLTVWRSSGYYWTCRGHNHSWDWLFCNWTQKVMCFPTYRIVLVIKKSLAFRAANPILFYINP